MSEQNKDPEFNLSYVFLKDLSFNFDPSKARANSENEVKIILDTVGKSLEDDQQETLVQLIVKIMNSDGEEFINFEVIYGGVFIAKNLPENLKDYIIYYDGGAVLWTYAANALDENLSRAGLTALNLKTRDYRQLLNQTLLNRKNQETK